MVQRLIRKIKAKMIAGAQTSAVKIEEAARTGKLHIEILAERRKLHNAQAELGKAVFKALDEGAPEKLSEIDSVAQLVNEIKNISKNIIILEGSLKDDIPAGEGD